MEKIHYLKTFIILQDKSTHDLSNLLNDGSRLYAYEEIVNILNKLGFEEEESNKIIGSLILTLEYKPNIVFTKDTDLDVIEIPEEKDRSIGYIERGRYKNFGSYYVSGTYSDLEALYKAKIGHFDDSEIYDSDYDFIDLEIDENDIETL